MDDARALLVDALSYRKTYQRHVSTDIEYAGLIAQYIEASGNADEAVVRLARDCEELVECLRALELTRVLPKPRQCTAAVMQVWRLFKDKEQAHRAMLGRDLRYAIFNDNRHEQHSWLWRS